VNIQPNYSSQQLRDDRIKSCGFRSNPEKPITDGTGTSAIDQILRKLDWNLIRTFRVIVASGGVSNASVSLMRTQPAISAALKRLEAQLGILLVNRNCASFALTREGEEIYRYSGGVGKIMEMICATATRQTPSAVQKIYISSNTALPIHLFKSEFFQSASGSNRFEFQIVPPNEFYAAKLTDQNAWYVSHDAEQSAQTESVNISTQTVGIFIADHLAENGQADSLTEYGLSWIIVEGTKECIGLSAINQIQSSHMGLRMHPTVVGSFSLAADVARAGMGIAVLPLGIGTTEHEYLGLMRLPQFGVGTIKTFLTSCRPISQLPERDRGFIRSIAKEGEQGGCISGKIGSRKSEGK